MNGLAFKQLKDSQLPATLNLCPDSPEFALKVNRALEWLLACGSFEGTIRLAEFCLEERCFTTPGCVQNVEAIRLSHSAARIENGWYRFLPGLSTRWETGDLWFEYRDQIPSLRSLCRPCLLRAFASHPLDYGKTITFLGYDANNLWVRTLQSGVMADGELVTLASPFVETLTQFSSVTAVLKDETNAAVRVFSRPASSSNLEPFGVYEHWETSPSYQRYSVRGNCLASFPQRVEAKVKLAFIPVRRDGDILPIGNRIAMEMAVMGVKAMDDGDLARADALLYGDARNKRLGAVPMLNQEIQTNTGDRFAANIRVGGPCGFRTIMRGFV